MNTALVSLISAFTGASIQYLFTRYLEDQRHYRTLRTQAYTDFLKYAADITHLKSEPDHPSRKELVARITDSKARICLYGSKEVIAKMASFERLGAIIISEEQRTAFVQVVAAMRTDSKTGARVESQDLTLILLQKKLAP